MSETRISSIDFRSFEPYYAQLKRILLKDLEDNFEEGHLLPQRRTCAPNTP